MKALERAIDGDCEEAIARLRQLIDDEPELQDRYYLAVCLLLQGDARFVQLRNDDALASIHAARELVEMLARENPTVKSYQLQLAEVYFRIADVHKETGQVAEARAEYQRALDVLAKVQAKYPKDTDISDFAKEIETLLAELTPDGA